MTRFPTWLKRPPPVIGKSLKVAQRLKAQALHTVCAGARCPNLLECFGKGTATFLILGDTCTRACRFCAITGGTPAPVEADEPERLARIICDLDLKHIVITSVTRDDLPDGGSNHFARTITAVRRVKPTAIIEVLTPDFQGVDAALRIVLAARPDIFNHNVETVPRLYPQVRPQADYQRSLHLLVSARQMVPEIITKSGLMLGLGEEKAEVVAVLRDLRAAGCDMVTIGQYLQPRRDKCLEVVRFIPPEEFNRYQEIGQSLGFRAVAAGPFVRSSYDAGNLFRKIPTTPT